MKHRRIFWQLYPALLMLFLLCIIMPFVTAEYTYKEFVLIVIFLLMALTLIVKKFSKTIATPLERMKNQAEKFAQGNSKEKFLNSDIKLEEVARLAQSLNKMGAEINRLEHLRKDFVANVSHELRTPLTAIQGFIETLLETDVNGRETRDKFLTIIKKHTIRLNTIIEDLLSLSQIEKATDKGKIKLINQKLAPVIASSISICEQKASKKNITIHFKNTHNSNVNINSLLIEQAVVNLLDNAIKHSPPSSKITIESKEKNAQSVITVCDMGPGIPKQHHHRLFERFYSVDKARSREMGGTGLGLSIVKHIVLAHHGKVWVESNVGKGSSFFISIPGSNISLL